MGVGQRRPESGASLPGRLTQAVREDDLAGLALLPEGRTATGSAYLLVQIEDVL